MLFSRLICWSIGSFSRILLIHPKLHVACSGLQFEPSAFLRVNWHRGKGTSNSELTRVKMGRLAISKPGGNETWNHTERWIKKKKNTNLEEIKTVLVLPISELKHSWKQKKSVKYIWKCWKKLKALHIVIIALSWKVTTHSTESIFYNSYNNYHQCGSYCYREEKGLVTATVRVIYCCITSVMPNPDPKKLKNS